MKKLFWLAAIVAGNAFFASANAGTNSGIDKESKKQLRKERREERKEQWLHSVNAITESQFNYDFPQAKNVNWTEGAFAEASFDDGTVQKTAYYDRDNELVGTTQPVDYLALPEKAREHIEKKYADYTVSRVILFDDNEVNDTNMNLFDRSFEDEDVYFAVLSKDSKQIMLKITPEGLVYFFQDYK